MDRRNGGRGGVARQDVNMNDVVYGCGFCHGGGMRISRVPGPDPFPFLDPVRGHVVCSASNNLALRTSMGRGDGHEASSSIDIPNLQSLPQMEHYWESWGSSGYQPQLQPQLQPSPFPLLLSVSFQRLCERMLHRASARSLRPGIAGRPLQVFRVGTAPRFRCRTVETV
jgi:hypothetical protein